MIAINVRLCDYGHIGNGNIHTRPLINAQSAQGEQVIEHLADEAESKGLRGSIVRSMGTGCRVLDTSRKCLVLILTGYSSK